MADGIAGWCHDGVCLPIVCGNSFLDRGEACDDGDTESGDGCSSDCMSTETCGNGIIDPITLIGALAVADEQCDDGNAVTGDGCSSTCVTERDQWAPIVTAPPPALHGAAMAYDPARGRVVLFGGSGLATVELNPHTYEWDGAAWLRIPTTLAPSSRVGGVAVYDAARRRVVLFGGHGNGDDRAGFGDTWEWDGTTWMLHRPPVSPPPRTSHAMTYDSARKVVVLFGGYGGTILDDTWEWDGTTWREVTVAVRPAARGHHAMAYDPKRGVTVLAGGGNEDTRTTDTWEYDGTSWMAGPPAPATLYRSAMAYDLAAETVIAYGGTDLSFGAVAGTWSYTAQGWTNLAQAAPGALYGVAVAPDPATGRILLFGGRDQSAVSGQTWRWTGSSWAQAPAQLSPSLRELSATANDPLRGVSWMYGGADPSASNELWSFDGSRWRRHASGPPALIGAGMAFDLERRAVFVFGGGSTLTPQTFETWRWNGQTWSQVTTSTTPPPRLLPAVAYDAARGRIVMFGGLSGSGGVLDDTWELDGTTWQLVPAAMKPPARYAASAAYNPLSRRVTVTNGYNSFHQPTFDDAWSWDGSTWTRVVASSPLSSRGTAPLVFDFARQRAILFGGFGPDGSTVGDTFSLDADGYRLVVTEQRPAARGGHAGFVSPDGNGVMIFGGSDNGTFLDGLWRLRSDSTSPREQCALVVDNDHDGLAGCADPDCWATCTPTCPLGRDCPPSAPRCGDGTCNAALESCRSCPGDCGGCTARCGDMFCDAGETQAACPGDCTP